MFASDLFDLKKQLARHPMFSCILNLVSTSGFGSTRTDGFVDIGWAFGLAFPTAMATECLSNLMTAVTFTDDGSMSDV